MHEMDSGRLAAEARAALDDLQRRAGGLAPARDTIGLSGHVDDFPERFLAWTWLARALRDRYDLRDPVTTTLKQAMFGVTRDEEMSEHLHQVAAVLTAQERGDAEQVDSGLAAFDSPISQGPAMQMIVLTAEELVRQAARKARRSQGEVLDSLRTELAGQGNARLGR
jgi:hypothetical protein